MNKVKFILLFPGLILLTCIAIIAGLHIHEELITSNDPTDYRYPVTDLLHSKYVDANELIESGEFKPQYCEGRIDKLIRLKPIIIKKEKEAELQAKLKEWQKETGVDTRDTIIYANLKYEYSQLLDKEPLNCYSIKLSSLVKLYIRFDEDGDIFGGFNDSSWVVNSCDV